MSRGDRRDPIFKKEEDHRLFIETLDQACEKTGWQVHAWCLMSNHFHLVIETPCANLVAGMKWLLGTYTGRFNRRHQEFGHLFSGRYKALIVDGSASGYLKTVCDYVHLNPARAKALAATEAAVPTGGAAWGVICEAEEPAVLAAGGPVAGRARNCQRQPSRAAGV